MNNVVAMFSESLLLQNQLCNNQFFESRPKCSCRSH